MSYRPVIVWKGYRVTAGMAYFRTGIIGLSRTVLQTEEAVRVTLLHEYAHLLAVHRSGARAKGHGPAWRRAMADLGLEPKVRHNYEVQRNEPRQRVSYRCVRCGAILYRKKKLPRHRKYMHLNCGGDIRLVHVARVTAPPGTT